jgi:hypothetical protein
MIKHTNCSTFVHKLFVWFEPHTVNLYILEQVTMCLPHANSKQILTNKVLAEELKESLNGQPSTWRLFPNKGFITHPTPSAEALVRYIHYTLHGGSWNTSVAAGRKSAGAIFKKYKTYSNWHLELHANMNYKKMEMSFWYFIVTFEFWW